jgi:hypothetical protein
MANTVLLWLLLLAEVDVSVVVFSRSVAMIVIFMKKKNLLMNVTIAVAETDTFEVMTADDYM